MSLGHIIRATARYYIAMLRLVNTLTDSFLANILNHMSLGHVIEYIPLKDH